MAFWLEFYDGSSWYSVATESYLDNKTISISGAVNGSGALSSSINTSLSSTQNMNGLSLNFNWSNSGSFAEYHVANKLQDSSPPPQFVYDVLAGFGGTLRGWQLIFQPGLSSSLLANFEVDYIHPTAGRLIPFKINTFGSSLRTYFGTSVDMQGSNLIINSANPVNSQDLTTKNYVDSKVFDINSSTSGQLNINRLSGYPANSSLFLRGDGAWASPSSSVIDINTGTTGQLNISRLSGYPASSSLFLSGNGSWVNPLNITTNNSQYVMTINNTNLSAYSTGLLINYNGLNGVEFGFNTSTDEAYVWASNTASLKFGTNSIKRMELLNNGMLNVYYGITVTGNISAQTGTLMANNLATYNSGSIVCLNPFAMNNNSITGLANPSNSQDAVTKNYADTFILTPSRISGYPANSSLFLRGDGAWASPGGSAGLSNNSINVNTDGGNTNWLRRNINTTTGVQVYGLTSSGYIIENNIGESAGIGFDGSTDTCTIWAAGDGGTYLNIQDEDSSNTRVAYVATTGAWTVVSSEKRKHSIKNKANNNILERFLKLSVKTYGYKYPVEEGFTKKKEKRIEKKSNKMATGLILEEVFKIFPNCIPDYYNPLFQKKRKNRLRLEKEIKDIKNAGIDYNTLMCYFIMAFQELAKKVEFLERKLEKAYNLQS